MGLRDLKKLQREKEIEQFLLAYGITKQDLTYLHEALLKVKESKNQEYSPQTVSEKQRKDFEAYANKVGTPQKIVEEYSKSVERFYPNGDKPKTKTNNDKL